MRNPKDAENRQMALNHALETARLNNLDGLNRIDDGEVVKTAEKYYEFLKGDES